MKEDETAAWKGRTTNMDILYEITGDEVVSLACSVAVLEMGHCQCAPGYRVGPAVRDAFLLHFVQEGKGVFRSGAQARELSRGEGFLLTPGELVQYVSDGLHPWKYAWIAFSGEKAWPVLESCGLSRQNRFFQFDPDLTCGEMLQWQVQAANWVAGRNLLMSGFLFRLLAEIREGQKLIAANDDKSRKQQYVENALRFLGRNLHRSMQIQEMAEHVGIHPRHLTSLFKQVTGSSPYAYLQELRMERACVLLLEDHLSVGDVARSVGYEDPLHFSRRFHQMKGCSPLMWRKQVGKAQRMVNA